MISEEKQKRAIVKTLDVLEDGKIFEDMLKKKGKNAKKLD